MRPLEHDYIAAGTAFPANLGTNPRLQRPKPAPRPITHHEPSNVAGLLALVVNRTHPGVSNGDRSLCDSPVSRGEPIASFFDQGKSLRIRNQRSRR